MLAGSTAMIVVKAVWGIVCSLEIHGCAVAALRDLCLRSIMVRCGAHAPRATNNSRANNNY